MLRRIAGSVALLAVLAGAAPAQNADTILLDGKIVTFEAAPAEALAVRGDRIVAIGRSADISALGGPATRVIDLAGRTVIPGLIDSHIHAIRAGLTYTTEVHWIGARSLGEALDRLRAAAQAAPKGSWLVVAGGWVETQFAEGRRPTQAEIAAAAPDHHVYVQLLYSAVLLTEGGIEKLGIANDAEFASRLKIETGADGKPTGWIAADNRTISDLFDRLPRPSLEQQVAGTRAFFRTLNSLGITGVLDPGGYNLPIEAYRALFKVWRDRALTIRVVYSLCAPRRDHELEDFPALTAMLPMGFGDEWLRFNGIGENVTWGMYNNDAPSEVQKEQLYQALRWASTPGPDGDLPLAQQPLGPSPARRAGARESRDTGRRTALVDRASQRRLSAKPRTDEGDGRRVADAERVLFSRRGVPRPARSGGDPARAADRHRATDGNTRRRGHRCAQGDVLQSVRVAAMDARRQDRRGPADA